MKRSVILGLAIGLAIGLCAMPLAAMAQTPASAVTPTPPPSDLLPMVPAPKAGVYSQQTVNPTRFRLTVTGKTFTSREAVEKYLAWRAAELTLAQKGTWFTLVEGRQKGDAGPEPVNDDPARAGKRYSFRMAYWRPVWRYKTGGAAWSTWSPFSGAAFFATGKDPKTVTEFEASADIVVRKGIMDGNNPLGFEASALSDLLINQVSPPE
ncbi:MAG: hypothetical protein V4601_00270 [Pseudomonadota bacterium]